jgi:hypothetical protein
MKKRNGFRSTTPLVAPIFIASQLLVKYDLSYSSTLLTQGARNHVKLFFMTSKLAYFLAYPISLLFVPSSIETATWNEKLVIYDLWVCNCEAIWLAVFPGS